MPPDEKVSSWIQYQELVLNELERHSRSLDDIRNHILKLEVELATLKVRAGLWGALGATIPAMGIVLFELLKNKF